MYHRFQEIGTENNAFGVAIWWGDELGKKVVVDEQVSEIRNRKSEIGNQNVDLFSDF